MFTSGWEDPGMDSLLFLKVLCDLERQKIETIPDNAFAQEASASNQPIGKTKFQSFVKIYMQKEYGIGGSQGSKRYACQKCSCLFRRKRHLRLHLQFKCNHKCLGCSECYANIHNLYNSLGEENPEPVKAFTCSICPSSFLTHAGLAIHEECHPQPGKVLECESCSLKFNTRLEFNRHQKTHVTLVAYNCKRCSKVFSTLPNLAKHVRVRHRAPKEELGNHFLLQPHEDSDNDEELPDGVSDEDEESKAVEDNDKGLPEEARSKVCGMCHQWFKSVPLLKLHVCNEFPSHEQLDKLNNIQCPACLETFSSMVALKMHCGTHTGDDPLSCTLCDKKFSSLRKVNEHFDYHGRNTCTKCGVLFRTKLAILLHHCGFTQRCFVCDKLFPTQSAFKRHQLVHPPSKDFAYKCSECKKSFAKESYFRAHQIKHTGKQPFICSICDQKFLMYGPFKKHVTGHLAVFPYECNTCCRKFSVARSLVLHLKTHLKDGPVEEEDIPEDPFVLPKEEVTIEPFVPPKEEPPEEHAVLNDEEPPEKPAILADERLSKKPAVLADEELPKELAVPGNAESPSISGFSCHKCNKVLRQQHQLFIHLRDSHGDAPPYLFHCDLCSRGFYHRLHLNSHKLYCSQKNAEERKQVTEKLVKTKEISFEERKLKCPECDKKYFTQQHLENHMYVHRDPSEYPYHCPLCGAGYVREFSLKQHLDKCNGADSNTAKNPLKCKVCGASFIDEKRLNRHIEAHESAWECPFCKEKFLTKKGRLHHKRKCTPENAKYKTFRKPKKAPTIYSCPTCERRFILRDRFEAHVASHEGIMRFQCPTCFNKFMSINNFKRHKCKFKIEPHNSENVATS